MWNKIELSQLANRKEKEAEMVKVKKNKGGLSFVNLDPSDLFHKDKQNQVNSICTIYSDKNLVTIMLLNYYDLRVLCSSDTSIQEGYDRQTIVSDISHHGITQ